MADGHYVVDPASMETKFVPDQYAIELRITLRKIATKTEADDALEKVVEKIEKELLDGEYLSVAEVYTY